MEKIPGGFKLIAHKLLENDLMDKPPLYAKLWLWMLLRAHWKDRDKLKRGQFLTSISEMQNAMSYKIGYRKHTPTIGEIRSAYEAFTNNTMISTTKTTRGMIITIINYGYYQDINNYEQHNEQHNENSTKRTITTQDTERKRIKELKHLSEFEQFYSAYPKHEGRKSALAAWNKYNGEMKNLFPMIMQAIETQKQSFGSCLNPEGGKRFIPLPSTWLNGERWKDDLVDNLFTAHDSALRELL
jgi:hypothetical protein